MVRNKTFVYKSVPHGWPVEGQDLAIESTDFDLSQPPPQNGLITKNFYASFDPAQRSSMRDPAIRSYAPAAKYGPVQTISMIARVVRSDDEKFKEGDLILVATGMQEYSAVPAEKAAGATRLKNPDGLPLDTFLGALGLPGLTAYGSLMEIGRPKKGETIFVSAAAGAVGQLVGQYALREGLKVIGSVGDDRKLNFITEELGFSGGFNYKKESTATALERLAPDGLDIYYDKVGGETLDAAIAAMKQYGRIVACGSVSQYNVKPGEGYGVKNTPMMVRMRLSWQGFLVFDENIAKYRTEMDEKVAGWIKDGSLKTKCHVTDGIENAFAGFVGMLKGENLGKSILKIADLEEV